MKSVLSLPDPCPFPEKGKKTLSEKQKVIYSPMSDVGGVQYDPDAIYVTLSTANFTYVAVILLLLSLMMLLLLLGSSSCFCC